ncbi:MAG: hypothetical protein N3E51_05035 [Candidatus Micrarchaeota archaeon]|nr:hypothetical protein [Candidatus Micrarchaeota archaeon]
MLALAALALPALAADANQSAVHVGIYILNIGKFDVSTGSYTVDFYLSMRCEQECDPSSFEFMNGRATSLDKIIDEPNEKFYRIQAALSENIDLKEYPFDRHELPIVIEDKRNPKSSIVYVPDEKSSGIDPSVTLDGWELDGWNFRAEDHFYAPYNETYSRFVFNIGIKRIFLASVLKTFLPVIFIVIVGLLALLIEERDKLWTRIGINTSALIAAVMFHLNVASSIPPVGYLTFADKFMIVTYVVLVLSLLSSILMMMHAKAGEERLEKQIYRWSLYGIPAFAAIGYALLFLA